MIEKCWDADPNNRPTFSQIYRMPSFNFEEGESNGNDNYFLENVNVDKFVEYLKIIDDDFKIIWKEITHQNMNITKN